MFSFLYSIVGEGLGSSKGKLFCLGASWGRVLTLDQFQKRGWSLANLCSLCLVLKEFIDHVLIDREKTRI